MPNNDLPGTVDVKQSPACASDAPQSTTAPDAEVSAQATTGLDLRGYELMERLGGGGMGDVYRAGDPALGRDLAVKVMKADLQGYSAAEQRFLREARVTGSLQHPGIVPIYNLGRLADGRLHYTMRLVRGRTFADILKEEAGKPERLPALLAIFEKVCQAVAYAHSKQVIHRDLKPANVMVGRFGEVQVMDWGLAKLLSAEEEPAAAEESAASEGTRIHTEAADTPLAQTRMGREMGTPAYMPPEQALGEWDTVDERADVFALGAILCEILTGRPPYSSGDSNEALRKAKRGELTQALARLESCGADAALLGLCRDCLTPARESRPRDAGIVAQRVASYQAEVQERLRRAELERAAAQVKANEERKRRRWMFAAFLLLLVGGAVSTCLAVWALTAAEAERQARKAEIEQRKQAEISEADAKAVLEYFQIKVLSAGRPKDQEGGLGTGVTLRQAVDKAQKDIADSFKDRPLVEASIRDTLGTTYWYLGQAALAIHQHEQAFVLRVAKLGPDHADTLNTRYHLAIAYRDIGRIADAIRLHEQNLKQHEVGLEPDHSDTLNTRHHLAIAYRDAGRIADAIRLHEQNLKRREVKLGPDHSDTLNTRHHLANAYHDAGRTVEAIRLHEQTLKQREVKLGADHPETLFSRGSLVYDYYAAGRTTDAILLGEQTLKQMEAKIGLDHPDTCTCRNNLANAYQSASRTDEAIRLHEQNSNLFEAKLGPDHASTLFSRTNLADAYHAAGRADEAIRLHERTLKQKEANLGADHTDTLHSRSALANAYRSAGRTADAIRLYERTLKQQEGKLGADHSETLVSRNNLANAYQSAGRTADAIRLYEQNLKLHETKLGADHPYTLISMANLGAAYRNAGRLKEAVPLLETALQRGRQRSGGLPTSLAWLPGVLAQTYEQVERFTKAETIYRDSLEQAQRQFGPDDPRTANALSLLSLNLLKQKKCSDAEPLLRRCLAIRDKKQPDAWNTFNTRSSLGEALLGQKKYAEAEPLLVQGYEGMKQREDKIPAAYRQLRFSEALERLVRLYEATEQKDKAADWRKKLQEAKAAEKKPKS